MDIMKYSTKITLFNSYFDSNGNLTAKSILNIFQDVSSIHAEQLGVGYNQLLKQNLFWVLSRVKFDVIKMPQINEIVIVETWPHVKGKIDFDRDIKILNAHNEVLIVGTTKWCVINTISRSLQRGEHVNYLGEYCLDVNYSTRFNKIVLPDGNFTQKFVYPVMFCDIDNNKHMNNTHYASLVFNAIDNKLVKHFEINFINECLLGDKIVVSSTKTETGEFVLGTVNNTTTFVAYVQ